ncbi:MAG TPA: 2-hydroxyhepta-2,4-diene-1,7-dioate isomerase [Flavobacteriales bacterium]|jgi:2-keto-4-pentenoate hydratase/2-oxohepta-3-ene-1,7-dioic acid hydratase in catechol pathway|nr:2-hydroxyhepta-2,4-diene-1,7-dioate isomerase [Flavobacteriales bacterium]
MKIICVGRNYAEHANELNNPLPEQPVIFMKPDSAVLLKKRPFYIPDWTDNVHYEMEVVIKINRIGKNIQRKFAYKYYEELTGGIDFTARDVQSKCKEKSWPWELAKAFDGSAAIGKMISKNNLPPIQELNFELKKNSETVQIGKTDEMLFTVDQIIEFVSQYFTLKIGDLIFTGTPAGVGKVNAGDVLQGFIETKEVFNISVK